jgi:hypothetical protein
MPDERPAPKRPPESTAPVAGPRLTPPEMEAVIARAIELQASEEERSGVEGIDATELVRIAGELGIAPSHVHQAIAEVRGRPAAERDLLTSLFGESQITVSRYLPMPAARAREQIDRYLVDREAMVVLRRMGERTIYERGAGVGAAVARAAGTMGARHPLLKAKSLQVAVNAVDDRSCFVALSVDLATQRSGTAAATASGGLILGTAATVVGITILPPLALAALPLFGGFTYMLRSSYRKAITRWRTQLESLLDRLEHKELLDSGPGPQNLLKRFGL